MHIYIYIYIHTYMPCPLSAGTAYSRLRALDMGLVRAADDLGAALNDIRDLGVVRPICIILERTGGLSLKRLKCVLVPLATRCTPHTREIIRQWLVSHCPAWVHFEIKGSTRYLGFTLGPAAGFISTSRRSSLDAMASPIRTRTMSGAPLFGRHSPKRASRTFSVRGRLRVSCPQTRSELPSFRGHLCCGGEWGTSVAHGSGCSSRRWLRIWP